MNILKLSTRNTKKSISHLQKRSNTNQAKKSFKKTGILMLNLGGPPTLDEVEPFLTRLLSDKEIIDIPFQKQLGGYMAKKRALSVVKQYESIGGGSPILKWTNEQGKGMCDDLNAVYGVDSFKHYVGFRYASPLTEDALEEIKRDGIERLIVFSQYPQYSCSTTGSSLNELYRQVNRIGLPGVDISIIDRWPTNPGLIDTFSDLICETLEKEFTDKERDDVVLLFSAHSLPLSVVNRGDAYPMEVGSTVQGVSEELKKRGINNHFRLVWQSKVGPAKWIKPSTQEAIVGFGEKGRKNQLLIPIAFTSDHIETLYEYDIQYAELAKGKNIKLRRSPSLNATPKFIKTLSNMIQTHLDTPTSHFGQYSTTCPTCTNPDCTSARKYFLAPQISN